MKTKHSLDEYNRKRDFSKTPEPQGGRPHKKPIFVVQEHWASHLHYDFRLEAFGVLKSWAVPKGPSIKVGEKRLAVETEDHPIDYARFEGTIPEGEYGAGKMTVWDRGTWTPPENLEEQFEKGHIEFELKGKKLQGRWLLQRTRKSESSKSQWLLLKRNEIANQSPTRRTPVRSSAKALSRPRKKKADPFPDTIAPQLALLMDSVPTSDRFIHEIKFDGYRTLAFIEKKSVRLVTRNGHDWTHKYAPLDQEIAKMKIQSAVFDGELVALDSNGHSDFSALQEAIKDRDMSGVFYYLFDLLYLNGEDLRPLPLEERKRLLKDVLESNPSRHLLYSDHVEGQGEELFAKAASEGLEGIVSKDRTQPYSSGRGSSWQKIKTSSRQEFVIGGYTDPEGARDGFGALLMGVYENKRLRYVGKVGTGFNQKNLAEVMTRLKKLEVETSSFEIAQPPRSRKIHWVKPRLVAEIEFKAWTRDGVLRHASFVGLRADKNATEVKLEKPASKTSEAGSELENQLETETLAGRSTKKAGNGFFISHPERIVYPSAGLRKIDIANYYKSVAPWLLEHVANRPLSLLRCPDQAGTDCFFQKHVDTLQFSEIQETLIRDQKVVSIDSEEGLLQLVQWGVLEPHTWQCHLDHPLNPDQMIFDLDPDVDLDWKKVVQTAWRMKDLLERLELKSFLKTSGGKGLHLHVPIAPLYTWEQVKAFTKSVCQQLEEEFPGEYTVNILKKTRHHKIFLDYLRNGFGATAIAPYSLRSRAEPTVAMPIRWTELNGLKSGAAFDYHSALHRLATQKKDPWDSYESHKQKIAILTPATPSPRKHA